MGAFHEPGLGDLIRDLQDQIDRLARRASSTPGSETLQQAVDQLTVLVNDLTAQVAAAIAANSYTQSQIDSKIANPPGNVTLAAGSLSAQGLSTSGSVTAGGNVSASGQVISTGIIRSPGTKSNTVTVSYSAVYIDGSGNMGGNTSTRRSKTNIAPLEIDLDALLALNGYRFQRITDVLEMGEAAPWQAGFMAEEVEPVAPLNVWHDEDGRVEGVRYEELVVPLTLALARERRERLAAQDELAAFKSTVLDRLQALEA